MEINDNSLNIREIIEKTKLNISKEYVLIYLRKIFLSLSNGGVTIYFVTFYHYLKLPIFISKKIFLSYSNED